MTFFSSSSYMGFATNVFLHPQFFSSSSSMAFPAMTCVYVSVDWIKINKERFESIFSMSAGSWRSCTAWMPGLRTRTTKRTAENSLNKSPNYSKIKFLVLLRSFHFIQRVDRPCDHAGCELWQNNKARFEFLEHKLFDNIRYGDQLREYNYSKILGEAVSAA